jgi:hypothetical protein
VKVKGKEKKICLPYTCTFAHFTRAGTHPGATELSQILGIKERSLMAATFGKTLRQDFH